MTISKLVMIMVFMALPSCVWGVDYLYSFNCHESKIEGAIKYVVIGRYKAVFRDCQGVIAYDPQHAQIKSVDLKIKTASIQSRCSWCDKIVVSRKLLDAAIYPGITFISKSFQKVDNTYTVRGSIDLHGISKILMCPFQLQDKAKELYVQGTWVLNRKDFNIIWNPWLDKGGVLVGDTLDVKWQLVAHRQ